MNEDYLEHHYTRHERSRSSRAEDEVLPWRKQKRWVSCLSVRSMQHLVRVVSLLGCNAVPIGEDFTPSVEGQANHSLLFILITEKKNAMQMVQHRSTLCLVSEAQSLMVTSNSSSLGWFFFQFCRGGFACSKPLIW